ncbi:MAG: hypothetical protein ACI8ZN_001716 [Bacteroidia bacterium]|jgi:hypothetical protein
MKKCTHFTVPLFRFFSLNSLGITDGSRPESRNQIPIKASKHSSLFGLILLLFVTAYGNGLKAQTVTLSDISITDVSGTKSASNVTDKTLCSGLSWNLGTSVSHSNIGNGSVTISYAWITNNNTHLTTTGDKSSSFNVQSVNKKSFFIQTVTVTLTVTATGTQTTKDANGKVISSKAVTAEASKEITLDVLEDFTSQLTATLTPSSSVCKNDQVTIIAGRVSTATIDWWDSEITGPDIFSSNVSSTYVFSATTSGEYVIKGYTSQTSGKCPVTKTATLTVNPLPTVKATASVPMICLGSELQLTGSGASTYIWTSTSNGNGLVQTSGTTVAAIPSTFGKMKYSVQGTDINGCVASANVSIDVFDNPQADWASVPHFIDYPTHTTALNIHNNSTPAVTPAGTTNYHWDWEYLSTNPTPSSSTLNINNNNQINHMYTTAGRKEVLLEAVSPSPANCKSKHQSHFYVTEDVNPNFTYTSGVCAGAPVTFVNISSLAHGGDINNVKSEWDFGDGSTIYSHAKLSATFDHVYSTPGTYTVKLTTYALNNTSVTYVKSYNVLIHTNPNISMFTTDGHCEGQNIEFTDVTSSWLSLPIVHKWDWENDGNFDEINNTYSSTDTRYHSYSQPGSYSVKLRREYSQTGCFSEITSTVVVDPTPVSESFANPANVCENEAIDINASSSTLSNGNISSFHWILTNNSSGQEWNRYSYSASAHTTTFDNNSSFTNPYMDDGSYSITVKVTSDLGCTDQDQLNFNVWPKPEPNFNFTEVCDLNDNSSAFINTSSGPGSSYAWDFASLGSSANQYPSFDFPASGTYTVSLTVSENTHNCAETVTKDVVVKPNPVAGFTIGSVACSNQAMEFFDNSTTSSGNLNFWEWNWDDGTTFSTQSSFANHKYTSSGLFNPIMKVTGSNGCWSESSTQIGVNEQPVKPTATILTNDNGHSSVICIEEEYRIEASPSSGYTFNWLWDGSEITGYEENFLTGTGDENLLSNDFQVRITDQNGCYNTSEVALITVIDLNTYLGFVGNVKNVICPSETVELTGFHPSSVQNYQWMLAAYDASTKTFASSFSNIGTNSKTFSINSSIPGRFSYVATRTYQGVTCSEQSEIEEVINAVPLELNETGNLVLDPINPISLSAVNHSYPVYTSFSWYLNDQIYSTAHIITPTLPGEYYLIAMGDCGIEKSNVVNFEIDCNNGGYNSNYSGNQTFTTATTLNPTSIGGVPYIKVSGNWDVFSNTLLLEDVVLIIDNCSRITVHNNAELDLKGATLVGCDDWEGVLNTGGLVSVLNSKISGAQVGIASTNNGDLSINNSLFSNNYLHVGVNGYNKVGTGSMSIVFSEFGNLKSTSSCNHPEINNWNMSGRSNVYFENSSNVAINENRFTSTIEDPTIQITAIEFNGISGSRLVKNVINGWCKNGVVVNASNSNWLDNNEIEFGFNNTDIRLSASMPPGPTTFVSTGLLASASDELQIEKNAFYSLDRGIEFYQNKSNPTISNIESNKFQGNMIGILSSTYNDPTLPPHNNTNDDVNINVGCNNFTNNIYGWLGTGTHPNQGSAGLASGNVFNGSIEWDLLVEYNNRKFYYSNYDPNSATSLIAGTVQLDGVPVSSSTYSFVTENSVVNSCSHMRLKAIATTNDISEEIVNPSVFPNPFEHIVFVQANTESSYNLELVDISGRKVISLQNLKGDQQLSVETLPKGMYFLYIYNSSINFSRKLVK